jgi:hypothetical protein
VEQSPSSEANSRSATQELPKILWNAKLHYRVLNSPPMVPILSKINPIHNTSYYFSVPSNETRILCLPIPFQNCQHFKRGSLYLLGLNVAWSVDVYALCILIMVIIPHTGHSLIQILSAIQSWKEFLEMRYNTLKGCVHEILKFERIRFEVITDRVVYSYILRLQ